MEIKQIWYCREALDFLLHCRMTHEGKCFFLEDAFSSPCFTCEIIITSLKCYLGINSSTGDWMTFLLMWLLHHLQVIQSCSVGGFCCIIITHCCSSSIWECREGLVQFPVLCISCASLQICLVKLQPLLFCVCVSFEGVWTQSWRCKSLWLQHLPLCVCLNHTLVPQLKIEEKYTISDYLLLEGKAFYSFYIGHFALRSLTPQAFEIDAISQTLALVLLLCSKTWCRWFWVQTVSTSETWC